jgi:uncharacterized membrane protein YbhN (UPF0104 family)
MLAWRRIMRQLGAPLGMHSVVTGFFWSFVPRYIPGSVWGYWSRGAWLAERHGIGYRVSTHGSLLEVGLGCFTALVVGGGYLLAGRAGGGVALVVALVVLWVAAVALGPVNGVVGAQLLEEDLAGLKNSPAIEWAGTLGLYLLALLCFGWGAAGVAQAFFEPPVGVGVFVGAATLAWLAGFLVLIVPSGLGVREATLAALLAAAGMDPWQGGLVAVVFRLVVVFAELCWLVAGLWLAAAGRHRAARTGQTVK